MARPKDCYLTLTVRNLPLGTTAQDVTDHINRHCSGTKPVVRPLVRDLNRPLLYTTVTICQESEAKCRAVRDRLNVTQIYPRAPTSEVRESGITVNDEFLGVTTLAEHENPHFDMYFIHGLGGHAFKSWSTDRDFPQMWPRDFLPNDIKERPLDPRSPDGPKLAGRFSTIGYRANIFSTWSATTTIEKAAENLLATLRADRPEGSERPMYFACHSLGGVVTCQALIQALRDDESKSEKQQHYRKVFFQNGQCLAKGFFFFGTPFEGSKLAGYASRIVRFLKGNDALIDSMKVQSDQLPTIVGKFNQLRSASETRIPIMIAYEMQPMYGVKFVTFPESAMSSFDVPTIGIDGDHRTMIKFPHNQDKSYREVSEHMIRIIQATLSGSSSSPPLEPNSPSGGPFAPSPPGRSQTNMTARTLPPAYPGPPIEAQYANPRTSSYGFGSVSSAASSSSQIPSPDHDAKPHAGNPWANNPWRQSTNGSSSGQDPAVAPVAFGELMQPGHKGAEDKTEFALLSQFDIVFLIDDTGSMSEMGGELRKSKWDELIESLRYTVDIVCKYDKDGVDVHFLCNDEKDEQGIKQGQRVLDLLTKEVSPDEEGGGTFISQPLWMILTAYLDKWEEFRRRISERLRPEKLKKLNLIVITDGAADDKESVEDVIVGAARRLDELGAPFDQVGIQFLQIGRDADAARWLLLLDESLKEKHKVRDIVDTRPWDSPQEINKSFQTRLVQILLGGVSRDIDKRQSVAMH